MMNMAIRFSIRHQSLVGISPWSLKQHLSTATMPSVLSTPIGIPEQWLQRRFRSLSANIQDAILHNVRSLTDRELLTFATLCSGSDCPVIWFMAFIRMVKAESYSVALDHPRASPFLGCRHLFSCEIKPDKRLWLTKNIMPQLLFEDILQFRAGRGLGHPFGSTSESTTRRRCPSRMYARYEMVRSPSQLQL